MKTPKEEAQEILDKYNNYLQQENCIVYVENAKQFAIICVEEVLKSLEEYDERTEQYLKQELGLEYFSHEKQNMDSTFRYWEKVKKELELL